MGTGMTGAMKSASKCFLVVWAVALSASGAVLHVDLRSTNPVPRYASWATAATNIQDAINAASSGDSVLVTNGLYRLSSQVSVTAGIKLISVNGPHATTLDGQSRTRCLYLNHAGGVVSGFAITRGYARGGGIDLRSGLVTDCVVSNNATTWDGGGILCYGGIVSNCTITCNFATEWGVASGAGISCKSAGLVVNCSILNNTNLQNVGGGVELENSAVMLNCLLSGNYAQDGGGAVALLGYTPIMRNCTIVANSASTSGGGVFGRPTESNVLWNCIVANNTSGDSFSNVYGAIPQRCCIPGTTATNNIAMSPPLTVAYRLMSGSPCIDAGAATVAPATDIDGESRWDHPGHPNVLSTVDIGSDEFVDMDTDDLPDSWERTFWPTLTNANALTDNDHDGIVEVVEYELDLNPASADTDGDGLDDGSELSLYGTNPRSGDTDADGLHDGNEILVFLTDALDVDTDDDGLSDGAEVNVYFTLPGDPDTDGDGLLDGREVFRHEFINTALTWTAAKADAERRGGHLATITDATEWAAIVAVIQPHSVVAWLGGTDVVEEGLWHWITGEPWNFTAWRRDAPNNVSNEDYLEIYLPGWNDAKGSLLRPYILERDYATDPTKPDTDGDGLADGDEWIADTIPTNNLSSLTITGIASSGNWLRVNWRGGTVVTQYLQRSTTLSADPQQWVTIWTNSPPTASHSEFANDADPSGVQFYRVKAVR